MTRLVRTLVVVLGALILLGGGGVFIVRANHPPPRTAAAVGSPSSTTTSSDGSVASTGATSSTARSTIVAPTTSPTAFSPFAALTTGLGTAMTGSNACLLVTDGTGRVLFEHQPDTPLIPASTQKLLVAAAALTTLGPTYRFTTKVVASSSPTAGGKVADLWLVGGGDPLLATPELIASTAGRARVAGYPWTPLSSLADSVAAAGIKAGINGIRGDDSYEDRLRFLPVWPALYQQQSQIGLLSALSANEGVQFTPPKSRLAQDPPNYAASELARLLQARKVAVGAAADQTAPAGGIVVASVQSVPLTQIVEAMLRASDNWIAELLVRAIDKASGGTGTTAGGTAIVLRDAAQAGIPLTGVKMDDGSGLSRTDRASCRELLAALDLGDQPAYTPLLDGLAVAAKTGTLAARYQGTPLAGTLRAKTGSLDNAGGMVGVVSGQTTMHFAFLDNDVESETALFAREDAVVGAIGSYSRGA